MMCLHTMNVHRLSFNPVAEPIHTLATKFGGQPLWVQEPPDWPRSASTGELMVFLGQVEIDPELFGAPAGRFAYLFMTPTDLAVKQDLPTYAPDSGENAVVIQTKQNERPYTLGQGPAVQQYVWDTGANHPRMILWEAEAVLEDGQEPDDEPAGGSKIGGRPWWLQADETPGTGWRLLLQMYEPGDTNMGIPGILYVFLSPEGDTGKLLWQC
jgi:hypothetical protein